MSLTPPAPDAVAIWQTQWLVPAATGCDSTVERCRKGGKNPIVYFESTPNGTSCWSGENAAILVGGGAALTYPGTKQIATAGGCSYTTGPFGTITIDVPIADVSLESGVAPLSNRLYTVTASTMTIAAGDAEHPPPDKGVHSSIGGVSVFNSPIGGQLFDLIDVVRAYDFVPGTGSGGGGGCETGDGSGHIAGASSGQARFHFHKDECDNDSDDEVDADDASGNMNFHSTQILSAGFDDAAHTVTITGLGTDNGLPVAFTAVGTDSSLVPPGLFTLTLSDGYSNTGALQDGSISIH